MNAPDPTATTESQPVTTPPTAATESAPESQGTSRKLKKRLKKTAPTKATKTAKITKAAKTTKATETVAPASVTAAVAEDAVAIETGTDELVVAEAQPADTVDTEQAVEVAEPAPIAEATPVEAPVDSTKATDLKPDESVPADEVDDVSKTDDLEKTDESTADKSAGKATETETAETVATPRKRGWVKWAALAVVLLAIPIAIAAIGLSEINRGRASRGVDVAGVSVGGTSETRVTGVVDDLASDFAGSEITVETDQGPFVATAADLGISVDTEATVDEVMEIGHTGSTFAQLGAWLGSFTGEKSVPLVLDVPVQDRIDAWVAEREIDIEPVEPEIQRSRSGFDFQPGVVGRRLGTSTIAESIPTRVNRASLPVLSGTFEVLTPELADDAPAAIAELVNRNTADGFTVRVAAEERSIDAESLRRWISIDTETQEVDIDGPAVDRFLAAEFADLTEEGDAARFEVSNREPEMIVPAYRGRICCREGAEQKVLDGILDGESEVELRLELNPSARSAEWAESMQIVEEIGGFTTRHPCCAGRVRNIQRMADLVKGAIIEPGELFSLNEYVGKRTRANGFTGGGVIYNGVFTEDVGGGVSQFVTTLFNAAFFAGLDFGEYQSHSLYISRYPYGREATISWPAPDFQIQNNTDYGVLIWPSYTSGSITVRLYSTEHAPGEQVAQYKSRGRCTNVETIRERTFPDGSKERDSVVATYRPAQGVRC